MKMELVLQVLEARKSVRQIIEAVRKSSLPLWPNASVELELSAVLYTDWDDQTAQLQRPVVAAYGGGELRGAHDERRSKEIFQLQGSFTRDPEALEGHQMTYILDKQICIHTYIHLYIYIYVFV